MHRCFFCQGFTSLFFSIRRTVSSSDIESARPGQTTRSAGNRKHNNDISEEENNIGQTVERLRKNYQQITWQRKTLSSDITHKGRLNIGICNAYLCHDKGKIGA
ncbi:hypothetical protein [Desulfonema magnum]|uniref:Uncharacterized protein n=1 Tax=Desulfonema magnum TaxID=45655 RepID=A0A975BTE0_9BACT|nr:hypothetical protein [Desulfonema magnum]QTA91429.1 Uncharacterized protein dnm_074960 [Desulfonema magnum]